MDRLLLILDLDETLVHAREEPLVRPPDLWFASYAVYERPFVREFLRACSHEYRLAVWTSSGREYAEAIVGWLFDGVALEFLWAHERCTIRFDPETLEPYSLKSLKKVKRQGYDLGRVLMVDDTPRKLERSYGNHIPIAPFEGDLKDDELKALLDFLRRFEELADVRLIEKRKWRGMP